VIGGGPRELGEGKKRKHQMLGRKKSIVGNHFFVWTSLTFGCNRRGVADERGTERNVR